MKHLLSPLESEHLQRLAQSEALLALDFDGTLAPIVERREEAQLRAETRRLLGQVAQLYPCAVISGRAQEDVRRRLGPVPVWEVVGNHGLEPSEGTERAAQQVQVWLPELSARLAGLAGVEVEDKRLSLAVHYRAAPDHALALAAVRAACAGLPGARLIGGKCVVNLVPTSGPNKGAALQRLQAKLGCPTALYVGDDETDEDVFALRLPGLLTVRVGQEAPTAATHYLRDQAEVDALLERLVALRQRAPHRRLG